MLWKTKLEGSCSGCPSIGLGPERSPHMIWMRNRTRATRIRWEQLMLPIKSTTLIWKAGRDPNNILMIHNKEMLRHSQDLPLCIRPYPRNASIRVHWYRKHSHCEEGNLRMLIFARMLWSNRGDRRHIYMKDFKLWRLTRMRHASWNPCRSEIRIRFINPQANTELMKSLKIRKIMTQSTPLSTSIRL